jgi:hypothetical protein
MLLLIFACCTIAFRPYAFKAEETGVYITEQVHFVTCPFVPQLRCQP